MAQYNRETVPNKTQRQVLTTRCEEAPLSSFSLPPNLEMFCLRIRFQARVSCLWANLERSTDNEPHRPSCACNRYPALGLGEVSKQPVGQAFQTAQTQLKGFAFSAPLCALAKLPGTRKDRFQARVTPLGLQ